jgi:biopolymer transport protein ExbB/TolQ
MLDFSYVFRVVWHLLDSPILQISHKTGGWNMVKALAQQFNTGGAFMWVILAVLAFALAVMIERYIYFFFYCSTNTSRMVGKLIDAIDNNNLSVAQTIVSKRKTPFHVLMKTAFERYIGGAKTERIMEGVERVSIQELPKISKRVNYLSLLANIATLLGLLGTITGLQTSFGSLATADATQKATLLANGISEAMNTTAFGLIVAVPCMIMYTILSNKQQALLKDIDNGVALFLDTVKERRG